MSQHFRITLKFILLLGTHELEPRVQEVTHRCPSMVPLVLKNPAPNPMHPPTGLLVLIPLSRNFPTLWLDEEPGSQLPTSPAIKSSLLMTTVGLEEGS